ncbi:respiratory nitrate reductase subunit gamma [Sphingomonas sp. KRR8]|uniref:respiratory nitrate reductase subunit gamma n=1 Tax=Sphingomonas sp. KRR8 TaxID=2942996 RepID=UPI0020225A60|nr:respiratory nitrate reductase subunit gamma [Sphingomonas sp. KRR8]URD62336.1 respiratory nitrate reductase subunit gamma [Sphingomonas sp. KRR8]
MGLYVHNALFGVYPYIALAVFLFGSLIRFDVDQYGWRSKSSQFLRRKQLVWGSILFHVGILGILGGHAVGLLTPVAVFDAMGVSHSFKQGLAIVAGGICGTAAMIGLLLLLHRRLTDPRIRKTSSFSDIAVLGLLFVQLSLGLLTIPLSLGHMDGHMMVQFMNYVQGIVTLRPDPALIAGVPVVFKLHMFIGFTLFLVFPFTRLVHVWSAPLSYAGRRYQVVRTKARQVVEQEDGDLPAYVPPQPRRHAPAPARRKAA